MAYDVAGRRTGLTDPNANRTTWMYDSADRMTTMIDPLGQATYVYDNNGQLIDSTDRDGRRVTYSYDSGGRRTAERWLTSSGGTVRTISYSYDNEGRMTGASDPDSLLTYTYDSGGNQLTAATSGASGQPSVTLTSTYNANNDRLSLADSLSGSTAVSFVYDIPHRLVSMVAGFGVNTYSIRFGYDAANNLTSINRMTPANSGGPKSVMTTLSYDAANHLTTMTNKYVNFGSGGGSALLTTYVYGYDAADRVTTEVNAEGTVTYTYDSGGQLLTARGSRTENYDYDSGGNRKTGYTTGAGNELTAGAGYTFTYDNEGNLTGKTSTANAWTYAYDYRNRMTGAVEKNSVGTTIMQATYTYDAQDRRIGFKVDDDGSGPHAAVQTWAVYDGVNPYADFSSAGALQERYLYGPAVDAILARNDASNNFAWYLTDRLGSVRDVVNTSGTVLDHIVYDGYGQVTSETSASSGDRFKYTGREYDATTGLYYYRDRYYDPTTGRFARQDPLAFAGGDSNLYRYCSNGPTDATDPSGDISQAFTIPIGVVAGGIYGAYAGGGSWSGIVQGAISGGLVGTLTPIGVGAGMAGLASIYASSASWSAWIYSSLAGAAGGYAGGLVGGGLGGTILSGAIGGATGDATGQALNIMAGGQSSYNYRQTAYAAAIGAATAGLMYGIGSGINYVRSKPTVSAPSSRLNCFPPDTLVATEAGARAIGRIEAGERVWAYDFQAGAWRLCVVECRMDNVFEGSLITLCLDGGEVTATERHPFWVIQGDDLEARPEPGHLAPGEDQGLSLPGRWVDSHELREGDTIFLKGGPTTIRRLSVRYGRSPVCNLTVRELHTFAVGTIQVLVHNSSGSAPSSGNPATTNSPEPFATTTETAASDSTLLSQVTTSPTSGPKPSPKFVPPTNPPQVPPSSIPPGWRVRSMPPTQQYPNGYWRLEKPMPGGGWQGIDPSTMKPGTQPQTHVEWPDPNV
jgi:RHS repeat-associated protein